MELRIFLLRFLKSVQKIYWMSVNGFILPNIIVALKLMGTISRLAEKATLEHTLKNTTGK